MDPFDVLARGVANKSNLALEQATVTAVVGNVATITLRGGTVAGVECLAPPEVGKRIWVLVDRSRVLGLVAGAGGGGAGGDEVSVAGVEPADPDIELWVDLEAVAPPFTGDKTYRHTQTALSAVWVVTHGLQKHPAVVAQDAAGNEIHGSVAYDSATQLTIRFAVAVTGYADCN